MKNVADSARRVLTRVAISPGGGSFAARCVANLVSADPGTLKEVSSNKQC